MKICLAVPVAPPYGGITNWTRLLTEYMDNYIEDVQYTVINTSPSKRVTENRSLFERIVISGFSMIKLNHELRELLKKGKIDVIHITTSGSLSIIRDIMFMKSSKKYNVPVVYHIRFGRIPQLSKGNSGEWRRLKKAFSLSKKVIAIDKRTMNVIEKNNISVAYIPNPINLKEIPYVECEQETKKAIMFLGWVIRAKGIEELLGAWQEIEHDGWWLCLVGPYDQAYMNELRQRFSMEDVVIQGELPHDEALKLLSNAGAFVLPSYTEGFPNVVLEAMALQKIIIATKVGAVEDMLEGNCGILLETPNIGELKQALLRVIREALQMQDMGLNAKRRVYENYSLEKVYRQYMKIWSSCLK